MTTTRELKKEVQRLDKKWTTIWLTVICMDVVLGIVFVANGYNIALIGVILGIILSAVSFINHKLDIKDLMKDVKKLEAMDKRIEKQERNNQKLREKWMNNKD